MDDLVQIEDDNTEVTVDRFKDLDLEHVTKVVTSDLELIKSTNTVSKQQMMDLENMFGKIDGLNPNEYTLVPSKVNIKKAINIIEKLVNDVDTESASLVNIFEENQVDILNNTNISLGKIKRMLSDLIRSSSLDTSFIKECLDNKRFIDLNEGGLVYSLLDVELSVLTKDNRLEITNEVDKLNIDKDRINEILDSIGNNDNPSNYKFLSLLHSNTLSLGSLSNIIVSNLTMRDLLDTVITNPELLLSSIGELEKELRGVVSNLVIGRSPTRSNFNVSMNTIKVMKDLIENERMSIMLLELTLLIFRRAV